MNDADSEEDKDDGNDDDNSATTRLSKCLAFRRYIITKALMLMSGSSSIVKAGTRFAPFVLSSGAETSTTKMRIAASLLLGPLLFVEFCSHCSDLDQTSIVISKSLSLLSDLSLAQLSLRAFTACVRGMTIDALCHSLSKAARVNALLQSARRKASVVVPSSADGWAFYELEPVETHCMEGVPSDEFELAKTLLPILSLAMSSRDGTAPSAEKHVCLFSELLSNNMYGEATECCYLICSAAEAFKEANCREMLGVNLLRAFERVREESCIGVLGLDHCDESNDHNACASAAIRVAMRLNCGLDGNTSVPLPGGLSKDRLRLARSKMGLPMAVVENWPESHLERLQKESLSQSGMIGIAPQVAWALSVTS